MRRALPVSPAPFSAVPPAAPHDPIKPFPQRFLEQASGFPPADTVPGPRDELEERVRAEERTQNARKLLLQCSSSSISSNFLSFAPKGSKGDHGADGEAGGKGDQVRGDPALSRSAQERPWPPGRFACRVDITPCPAFACRRTFLAKSHLRGFPPDASGSLSRSPPPRSVLGRLPLHFLPLLPRDSLPSVLGSPREQHPLPRVTLPPRPGSLLCDHGAR